jgi:hypothetical protein
MEKYYYLKQLDCFEWLQEKIPYMLDIFEREMKWYEEEATDDDIGECGENLSRFLLEVYSGSNDINEFIKEMAS